MKRFRYSLDSVLNYKTQVLDNLTAEHAVILGNVNRKMGEIDELKMTLTGYHDNFNQAKYTGVSIYDYRLFDMCIERIEGRIDEEQQKLHQLQIKEEEKKSQVVVAKVDTSRFEKLKGKRLGEYRNAERKEEEAFAEEFVMHTMMNSAGRVSLRG